MPLALVLFAPSVEPRARAGEIGPRRGPGRDPGVRSSAQGGAVDGPLETTEAPRLSTTKLRGGPKTAGQGGFGNFCRNKSSSAAGTTPGLIHRPRSGHYLETAAGAVTSRRKGTS